MNTRRMKSLRFAEFGPPSVLRIEELAVPKAREGEALVPVASGQRSIPATSQTSCGALQEHNSAANPRPRFCRRRCQWKAPGPRGLGQFLESRNRPRWISRGVCRCPGGDTVSQTEVVENRPSGRNRSSVHYGLGICRKYSSDPTRRDHSHSWCRRRSGTEQPHRLQTGNRRGSLARTLHPVRFQALSFPSIPKPKIFPSACPRTHRRREESMLSSTPWVAQCSSRRCDLSG